MSASAPDLHSFHCAFSVYLLPIIVLHIGPYKPSAVPDLTDRRFPYFFSCCLSPASCLPQCCNHTYLNYFIFLLPFLIAKSQTPQPSAVKLVQESWVLDLTSLTSNPCTSIRSPI